MKNFLQEGDVLTLTAPGGGVLSGVPVLIGSLLVVPAADALATATFEGRVEGVFSYTKTDDQAWIEGQNIYWDNAAKCFTSDPTLGKLVGTAAAAVAVTHGLTTGKVRLNGTSSPLLEGGPEGAIADLVITVPNTQGGATPTAAQVDTGITNTAAPIIAKLNALLAELRLNGIIVP